MSSWLALLLRRFAVGSCHGCWQGLLHRLTSNSSYRAAAACVSCW
jgi:hypothetical protein